MALLTIDHGQETEKNIYITDKGNQ